MFGQQWKHYKVLISCLDFLLMFVLFSYSQILNTCPHTFNAYVVSRQNASFHSSGLIGGEQLNSLALTSGSKFNIYVSTTFIT